MENQRRFMFIARSKPNELWATDFVSDSFATMPPISHQKRWISGRLQTTSNSILFNQASQHKMRLLNRSTENYGANA